MVPIVPGIASTAVLSASHRHTQFQGLSRLWMEFIYRCGASLSCHSYPDFLFDIQLQSLSSNTVSKQLHGFQLRFQNFNSKASREYLHGKKSHKYEPHLVLCSSFTWPLHFYLPLAVSLQCIQIIIVTIISQDYYYNMWEGWSETNQNQMLQLYILF